MRPKSKDFNSSINFVCVEGEYKPYHITIFIIACLAILGTVIFFIPSGKKEVLGAEFRFLSQKKLLKNVVQEKVDITKIVSDVDTTLVEEVEKIDSLKDKEIMGRPGVDNFEIKDSDLLSYNETGKENLRRFFQQLQQAPNKKMRIFHYGDSQIEGDRMTAFMRQRLQAKFGGNGPGFIPAINVYNTISFLQERSDNFERYTNFGGKSLQTTKNYGVLNSVGRFTPEIPDSINLDSLEIQTGWIEISPGTRTYRRNKEFNTIYLHYSDVLTACDLTIYQNENKIVTDTLIADSNYHVYPVHFPSTPGTIRFEFSSKISPNILGFSLEGDVGVQVDNIAMRGADGKFFGRINQGLAQQMYHDENVELFIMQFGGNTLVHLEDSIGVENSTRYFKNHLNILKRLRPQAAIIVIGPSDMSKLIEEEYTTYPLLPYFVEKMEAVTLEVGGAYFDTYQAMGGKNSMVAWVENDLASQDHVHFSNSGAKITAQKFYNALMTAYTQIMEPQKSVPKNASKDGYEVSENTVEDYKNQPVKTEVNEPKKEEKE